MLLASKNDVHKQKTPKMNPSSICKTLATGRQKQPGESIGRENKGKQHEFSKNGPHFV